MSGFSQHIDSPFPDANMLFDPAKAMLTAQGIQNNQLLNQGRQLDLSNANMEQVGRAAAGLLSAFPDEASRAANYPRVVGMLQSQGFAKNAPATYPGEGVLRSLVNQSVPVADQYKMGLITPPGLTDALGRSNAPLPGQPGYGGTTATPGASPIALPARGTGGPGAGASAPTAWLPFYEEASRETGIPVDVLIAQHRQESGFDPNAKGAAGEIGLSQIKPSTARDPGFGLTGVDPATLTGPENVRNNILFGARYLKARMGGGDPSNPAVQAAGLHAYNGGGDPNYVANVFRYRPTLAPSDPNAAVTTYTPGGGGAPGRVQVASVTPTTATDGTTAPPGSTAAPGAPAVPTPAAGVSTAAAPPAATPGVAQPPPSVGTGTNSPQFQAALELNRRATALEAQFPYSPAAKAQAASLRAQAALYMQADSVSVDPVTGIQTKQLSGERLNAAAPNARYEWDEGRGAYVDRTGTHPPVTPPSPRMMQTPSGDIVQSEPGGGARIVVPADTQGITARKAAETSGSAAGTATGKLTTQLATQGTMANRAISTIDEGMDQIARAKAGGINTGALTPWLAKYAAVAKSLGVLPLESLGINPDAIGNIQTAKKTLALVSGQILQQIIGPESQVTEGKINQFISATPGIETDPDALGRVLNWARAQFVYEREMAAKGMEDASLSPTGVLPANWLAKYYHEHGFAPLYDPTGAGEMKQPDGGAPSREPPASTASAPKSPTPPAVGTIKGGYRFKGGDPASQTSWERVQ